MEVVKSGWSHSLTYDGDPIELIFDTAIDSVTDHKGKTYVHLQIPEHLTSVFSDIDDFVRHQQHIDYSPWLRGANLLVCKLTGTCTASSTDSLGVPVSVKIRFGCFSKAGYCWLATRIHRINLG